MCSGQDVVGLAYGSGCLSYPEGSLRTGEFGMRGDEDPRREVQDLVECVEDGEFGSVGDLAGRWEPPGREAAFALHARLTLLSLA